MPVIDGFEVCARLRADPRGAAIPVVLLTANIPMTGDHQRAREVGADDFVVKPFDPGDLMARVRRLAQAGRRR
jgi:adenylate cyclase